VLVNQLAARSDVPPRPRHLGCGVWSLHRRGRCPPSSSLAALGVAVAAFWHTNPWLIPARTRTARRDQPFARRAGPPDGGAHRPEDKSLQRTPLRHGTGRRADVARSASTVRCRPCWADLDLLRDINNTYGHLAGDVVLSRHQPMSVREGVASLRTCLPASAGREFFDPKPPGSTTAKSKALRDRGADPPLRLRGSAGSRYETSSRADPRESERASFDSASQRHSLPTGRVANELIRTQAGAIAGLTREASRAGTARCSAANAESLRTSANGRPAAAALRARRLQIPLRGGSDRRRSPRSRCLRDVSKSGAPRRAAPGAGRARSSEPASGPHPAPRNSSLSSLLCLSGFRAPDPHLVRTARRRGGRARGYTRGTSETSSGLLVVAALVGGVQALALGVDEGAISSARLGALAGAALFARPCRSPAPRL
jgi:hypothetical protein